MFVFYYLWQLILVSPHNNSMSRRRKILYRSLARIWCLNRSECRLTMALFGAQQSPKAWFNRFNTGTEEMKFQARAVIVKSLTRERRQKIYLDTTSIFWHHISIYNNSRCRIPVYSTGIESLFITRKVGFFHLAVMEKPKLVYNKSMLGRSRIFLSEVER